MNFFKKTNDLHFSPVKARIEVKISLLVHKSLLLVEPRYIKNMLQWVLISILRSAVSSRLLDPILSGQITIQSSFCHCVPCFFNEPAEYELCTNDGLSTFMEKLK